MNKNSTFGGLLDFAKLLCGLGIRSEGPLHTCASTNPNPAETNQPPGLCDLVTDALCAPVDLSAPVYDHHGSIYAAGNYIMVSEFCSGDDD